MSKELNEKIGIGKCTWKMHSKPGYQHPLGKFGHYMGIVILLSFVLVIVPMYIATWFPSPLYFWFYREEPIPPKQFFDFDRHKVKYLSFWDKVGCEYCELANGTLQWMLAITNEIERRWCPIKNECDPHCPKAKEWRKDYLDFKHEPKDLLDYYENQFSQFFEQ
jgi:hypothetical protein